MSVPDGLYPKAYRAPGAMLEDDQGEWVSRVSAESLIDRLRQERDEQADLVTPLLERNAVLTRELDEARAGTLHCAYCATAEAEIAALRAEVERLHQCVASRPCEYMEWSGEAPCPSREADTTKWCEPCRVRAATVGGDDGE